MKELEIELQEETEDDIHLFKLSGVLGIEGAHGINQLIDACLKEDVVKIIMDISELEFISSAGIGVFLSYITDLRKKGGDIIFYGMNPDIEYIFQSLDVVDFFRNYRTKEVALERMRNNRTEVKQPTPTIMNDYAKDEHLSFIMKIISYSKKMEQSGIKDYFEKSLKELKAFINVKNIYLIPIESTLIKNVGNLDIGRGQLHNITLPRTEKILASIKKNKSVILISNLDKSFEDEQETFARYGCELIIPLIYEDTVFGLILIGNKELAAKFSNKELDTSEIFSNIVSMSYHNYLVSIQDFSDEDINRINMQLDKKVQELKTLFVLSQGLNKTMDKDEILQNLLIILVGEATTDKGIVFYRSNEKHFELMAKMGSVGDSFDDININKNENILKEEDLSNRPILLDNKVIRRFQNKALKEAIKENDIRLLIPIVAHQDLSGFIFLGEKVSNKEYSEDEFDIYETISIQASLSLENAKLFEKNEFMFRGILRTLISLLEAKDPYMHGHSKKVTKLTANFADYLNLDSELKKDLIFASILHDIGKLLIDDEILEKNGEITEEERAEIEKHPVEGINLLKNVPLSKNITDVIKHHHERYDGTGYPDNLKGDEIPYLARIIQLTNAFESMQSKSRYKKSMSLDEALQEVNDKSGTQFDPELSEKFIEFINSYKRG